MRPETAKVNVYKLRPGDLAELLDAELLHKAGFDEPRAVNVAGVPAIMTSAVRSRRAAAWCGTLARMIAEEIALPVVSPSAVLLLSVDGCNYGVTFGPDGYRLVNEAIERDFGLRIAIRTLDSDKVRKVTRLSLDTTSRVDRTSVPNGQHVRGFGVEEYAEIVNRLTGKARHLELTYTRGREVSLSIEGADGLKTRLGVNGGELVADLRALEGILARPPVDGLEFIEKLRRIPAKDPRLKSLDESLNEILRGRSVGAVGLALPDEYIDESDDVQSYKIRIADQVWADEDVHLEPILNMLRDHFSVDPLGHARTGRIVGCAESDGRRPTGTAYSLDKWMVAELRRGETRYIFQQGSWFEIADDAYSSFLRDRTAEALAVCPTWMLPPWRLGVHEGDYNKTVNSDGFIPLDKDLIRCRSHPGFEACDILGPEDELIHVKRAESSAPLSHLFNQGLVSADVLCADVGAMDQLRRKVAKVDRERATRLGNRPSRVVYAIQLEKGALTADSLFTFAKISLHRATQHIAGRLNIPVQVVEVPR